MIIDTCIIDDVLSDKYANALLIFTDLTAEKDAKISLRVARFSSCNRSITTDKRFLNGYIISKYYAAIVSKTSSRCK